MSCYGPPVIGTKLAPASVRCIVVAELLLVALALVALALALTVPGVELMVSGGDFGECHTWISVKIVTSASLSPRTHDTPM